MTHELSSLYDKLFISGKCAVCDAFLVAIEGEAMSYALLDAHIEIMFYCDGVKLSRESDAAVLSLGLGGGMLHGFLRHHFPKMNITSVEISARVANVASKWFDLKLDDRHSLIITDGVKFVEEQALKG
ncbi:hypothetical protein ANCCEY_10072 [Ancylostoma ceylanicum]|uniref:Methyltransferase type 11 domain-containing protein n=1 Tax=Ancylostoma ceylanicum TaxID=53326 RepID=A0A0D6LFV1_9BILA|nr:hypothetical protein ANCCEY_10072 [Ancylostoma ceylanicum]